MVLLHRRGTKTICAVTIACVLVALSPSVTSATVALRTGAQAPSVQAPRVQPSNKQASNKQASSNQTSNKAAKGDDGTSSTSLKAKPSEQTRRAHREVNALTASHEELERKMDALDSDYEAQQAAVMAAADAVVAAERDVEVANFRVKVANDEVDDAKKVVADYAVETYVRPPTSASVRVLSIADAQDAGFATDVLKIMTDERHKVVENLSVKKKIAAMEQTRADAAAKDAADRSAEAKGKLESLAELRNEQARLVAQLDERLEDAVAEAAALEAVDEQAARELAERERALRESERVAKLVATAPAAPPKVTNVVSTTPPRKSPPVTGAAQTPAPRPTTTQPPRPSPTTTAKPPVTKPPVTKPPAPPANVVTWAEIVYAGGIPVHRSVASNVQAMLDAARAAGFSLTGGGYRDSAGQIRTRMANCGTTYYDIYEKPSGQCTPPTAIPGRSMHERGLALDLKSNGALITSRSNPAFVWLSANASRFGFYNLPSEPWHWSTTGT